jgi:microcystin-dependent protein
MMELERTAVDLARKTWREPHSRFACGLAAGIIAVVGLSTQANADPFVGEVVTLANNFCPIGFAPLDGQLLPINQNQALFSLLGTTYGGDGVTTFALPRGKPVATLVQGAPLLQCIALIGIFPPRN